MTSKVTAILLAFTQGAEHSLTEVARLTGLPVSTTHRLANELTAQGLLVRADDGDSRAGEWTMPANTTSSLTEHAAFVVEDLCATAQGRVRFGVLTEANQVAYIQKVPGVGPVTQFNASATVPAHATALGRALLAFAPAGIRESAIRLAVSARTHPVRCPDEFRRNLSVTRLTRVALCRREFEPELCAVAVPVSAPTRDVVEAIEIARRTRPGHHHADDDHRLAQPRSGKVQTISTQEIPATADHLLTTSGADGR